MEKPRIVEEFETQIEYEISEAEKEGEKLDYYAHFIDFLQEKKDLTLIKGNVVGGSKINTKSPGGGMYTKLPYDIQQIDYGIKYLKFEQKKEKGNIVLIEGTARQSSLAFYYMYKAKAFPKRSGEITVDARFIHFLTGHNYDNVKKVISFPDKRKSDKTGKGTRSLINDLSVVLNQFKIIGFIQGVKLVENDIITLQNDIDSIIED